MSMNEEHVILQVFLVAVSCDLHATRKCSMDDVIFGYTWQSKQITFLCFEVAFNTMFIYIIGKSQL